MKKWIAIMLCLVLALCCLTGCKKDDQQTEEELLQAEEGAAQEGPATFEGQSLTVYTDLTEEDPAYGPYMEQVAQFEEMTGCTVSVSHYGTNLTLVLDNALKDGVTVDVFPVDSLQQLSTKTIYALDLTAYAQEDGLADRAYPICLDRIKAMTGGEELRAVPTAPSVTAMWYNADSFKAAGIKDAPKNIKEFEAVCDKLVEEGFQPIALDSAYAAANFAVHMERALGADTVAKLVSDGGWSENQDFVKACQQLIDWVNKGYFDENAPADWPFSQLSLADRTVMIYAHLDTLEMAEEMIGTDINWGCFSYPGDSNATYVNCEALCVNKSSLVPDLAYAYISFMTSGEADLAISQAAQTAPADRTNTSETYAQMMQILSETGAVYDYTTMLKGAVDLNEVIENVYAGTYATGEEAAAAFDAMY